MQDSLKQRAISAMMWTASGKVGTLVIQFVSNMVLARLLLPSDFGTIGMLMIFMAVSDVFISGGFGQALIQKKDVSHVDYCTVFFWNLVASVCIYVVLFFCAPLIAHFYNMPDLSSVLRIYSISLIISGLSVIQNTQLQKSLQFKKLYIRTIIATLLGTAVAIFMALSGFGIWSLVISSLVSSFFGSLLLWIVSPWRPSLVFSWVSFKGLFNFGSLMALSSIVDQLYQEIQGLLIGRIYSASDLGYYTQARKLQNIPTTSLSQIVSQVTFPVFSKIQNQKDHLKESVRKVSKAVTFLNFPLMMMLAVIAPSLIRLFYGQNWDASIPYFRVLCFVGMFYTILTTNNSVIKSLGKSGIFLKIRLIQRFVGITLVCVGASFSIMGMLYALLISNIFNYLVVSHFSAKLIGYSLFKQLKDIGSSFLLSIFAAALAYYMGEILLLNQYFVMCVQCFVYLIVYIGLSVLFHLEAFGMYRDIILSKIGRKK